MTMTNHRLTTHTQPNRLHGHRTDPHPCFGQTLGRQRANFYRWADRWQAVKPYVGRAAILAMGAATYIMLMAGW